jgi:hypothetical protein
MAVKKVDLAVSLIALLPVRSFPPKSQLVRLFHARAMQRTGCAIDANADSLVREMQWRRRIQICASSIDSLAPERERIVATKIAPSPPHGL